MASHQARRLKLDVEALESRAVPALWADVPTLCPVGDEDLPDDMPVCDPGAHFGWTDAHPELGYRHDGEKGDWAWSENDWYWQEPEGWWESGEKWDNTCDPGTLPWLGTEPWVVTALPVGAADPDGLPGMQPPGRDEYPGEGSDPWDSIGGDEMWASSFLEMPDVAVQVIGPSDTVRVGRKFVFTIVVSNRGTADAQQINLLIGLPSKTRFESVLSEVSLTKNGRTLTGTLDHLGAGEKIEIAVTLRAARKVGSFALTASASPSSPDEDLSNNTAVGYYYTRYAGRSLMGADLLTLLLRDRRKGS